MKKFDLYKFEKMSDVKELEAVSIEELTEYATILYSVYSKLASTIVILKECSGVDLAEADDIRAYFSLYGLGFTEISIYINKLELSVLEIKRMIAKIVTRD